MCILCTCLTLLITHYSWQTEKEQETPRTWVWGVPQVKIFSLEIINLCAYSDMCAEVDDEVKEPWVQFHWALVRELYSCLNKTRAVYKNHCAAVSKVIYWGINNNSRQLNCVKWQSYLSDFCLSYCTSCHHYTIEQVIHVSTCTCSHIHARELKVDLSAQLSIVASSTFKILSKQSSSWVDCWLIDLNSW